MTSQAVLLRQQERTLAQVTTLYSGVEEVHHSAAAAALHAHGGRLEGAAASAAAAETIAAVAVHLETRIDQLATKGERSPSTSTPVSHPALATATAAAPAHRTRSDQQAPATAQSHHKSAQP